VRVERSDTSNPPASGSTDKQSTILGAGEIRPPTLMVPFFLPICFAQIHLNPLVSGEGCRAHVPDGRRHLTFRISH